MILLSFIVITAVDCCPFNTTLKDFFVSLVFYLKWKYLNFCLRVDSAPCKLWPMRRRRLALQRPAPLPFALPRQPTQKVVQIALIKPTDIRTDGDKTRVTAIIWESKKCNQYNANKEKKNCNLACFLRLWIFLKNIFEKNISGIPSECQTSWFQIRPNLGPNCSQTTKVAPSGERVSTFYWISLLKLNLT